MKQILVTVELGEEACVEVYVVLRFWLADKPPGWERAWLCSVLDGFSTEGTADGCDNVHFLKLCGKADGRIIVADFSAGYTLFY